MNNEQKIKLADLLIEYLANSQEVQVNMPKHIGYLKQPFGLKGFKLAEKGTPVFELNDKYFIQLETLDGKSNLEVKFYKDTLLPSIDLLE